MTPFGASGQPYINHDGLVVDPTVALWTHLYAHYPNDLGQVVWGDGTISEMGANPSGEARYAFDYNNRGQAVGEGAVPGIGPHAMLWDNGTSTDLARLPAYAAGSGANAINNLGQAVGYSARVGEAHATLWQDGQLYDLNSLLPDLWNLSQAYYINDSGVILADGYSPAGVRTAWMLTPTGEPFPNGGVSTVPETSTLVLWSLIGSVTIGLGWWRRRKAA